MRAISVNSHLDMGGRGGRKVFFRREVVKNRERKRDEELEYMLEVSLSDEARTAFSVRKRM